MYKKYLKRFFDFVGAFLLLGILSPIFLTLTITLTAYYRGNPFFLQQRPGRFERPFYLIKFKSMRDATDKTGKPLPDALRLTSVGAFLRKTSLDELPQLINVLKGEMSFIGPRPLFMRYLPYYSERERKRHLVRPGITGLAQTSGRNSLRWDQRLELDVQYVENLSFFFDLKILFRTIWKVLHRADVAVLPSTLFGPLDEERKANAEHIRSSV